MVVLQALPEKKKGEEGKTTTETRLPFRFGGASRNVRTFLLATVLLYEEKVTLRAPFDWLDFNQWKLKIQQSNHVPLEQLHWLEGTGSSWDKNAPKGSASPRPSRSEWNGHNLVNGTNIVWLFWLEC